MAWSAGLALICIAGSSHAGPLHAPAIIGSMQGRSGAGVDHATATGYLREALNELGEHARPPLVGGQKRRPPARVGLEEAEQHAGAQVLRAVVEHDAEVMVEADDHAAQLIGAPERLVANTQLLRCSRSRRTSRY